MLERYFHQQHLVMPYVKDNSLCHLKNLQKYDNGTEKVVYFSTFTKKVYVGKAEKSKTLRDWGVRSKMALSRLEFVKFLYMINEIRVDAPNPYHLIHEGTQYDGLRMKLVIQRIGEKNLLALVRLNELKQDDDEPANITLIADSDSEGDPLSSEEMESDEEEDVKWKDEFEKWYFSNKDRIPRLATGLREWFEDPVVQHFYENDTFALETYRGKENNEKPSGGESGSGKRKAAAQATADDGKKKRRGGGKKERESDLVNELALLFRFMKNTQCKDIEECVLTYNDLLTDTYNCYYKKENEEELNDYIFDVYKKCDPKKIDEMWKACNV